MPSRFDDLYGIAQQLAREIMDQSRTVTSYRKRMPVTFYPGRVEPGRVGAGRIGLRFDTYPATVWIVPMSRGYLLELSWRYQSGDDPTSIASIQIPLGRYKTAPGAVREALKASRMSEREIRGLFQPLTKRYRDFRESPDAP